MKGGWFLPSGHPAGLPQPMEQSPGHPETHIILAGDEHGLPFSWGGPHRGDMHLQGQRPANTSAKHPSRTSGGGPLMGQKGGNQLRAGHCCAHGCPQDPGRLPPSKAWQRQGQWRPGGSEAGSAWPPDSPLSTPKHTAAEESKLVKAAFWLGLNAYLSFTPGTLLHKDILRPERRPPNPGSR